MIENDLDEIMCEVREHQSQLVKLDEETRLKLQEENENKLIDGDKVLLGLGLAIIISFVTWIFSFGLVKITLKFFGSGFMF